MILHLLLACTEPNGTPVARLPAPVCTTDDLPTEFALSAPVDIQIDDLHVPHVFAQNDADLMFGAGYQQATDRLYNLQQSKRATYGRLAEVDGEGSLDSDILAHVFDFESLACPTAHNIATDRPLEWTMALAFAAGINRRVDEVNAGTAPLPFGFGPEESNYAPEHIEAVDLIAMGKRIELGYSNQLEFEVLNTVAQALVNHYDEFPVYQSGADRFIVGGASLDGPPAPVHRPYLTEAPDIDMDKLRTLTDAHSMGHASNNWAVRGEYTDNGYPMIANDPHSALKNPARVYLYHLNSKDAGGTINVEGFGFPGVPGVQLGHTESVAWAATTNFGDGMDLYDVSINDGVADIGGNEVKVESRDVSIDVLQSDGSMTTETRTITVIPGSGVLLPEELLPVPKNLIAKGDLMVAWVGFDSTGAEEAVQYLDLDRATTIEEWAAALDYEIIGMQNWVAATTEGIRYKTHGRIPIRGGEPNHVMDASDASTLWTGEYVDADLLPALDGSQPYIVTANNDPFGNTADNNPLNDAVYHGSFYDPGFRADRIATELDRLTTRGNITREDMETLQFDTESGIAMRLLPLLDEAVSRIGTDESLAQYRGREDLLTMAAALDAWDGQMRPDSEPALLYRAWAAFLARRTLSSDLSSLFDSIDEKSPVTIAKIDLLAHEMDIASLTDGEADVDRLEALVEAGEWLAAHPEIKTWGDVHSAHFSAQYRDDVVMTTGGDESTVNVATCSFWKDGDLSTACVATEGAIFRQVTRFGADGVPEMAFHAGMSEAGETSDWLDGTWRDLPFRTEDVLAHTVETRTLTP